jgi:hypothetical protein
VGMTEQRNLGIILIKATGKLLANTLKQLVKLGDVSFEQIPIQIL